MNTIGKRLHVLRASKGNPPQKDIAEAIGVSVRSYNGWEGDRARPAYRNAERLAAYFDSTVDWILYGAEVTQDDRLRIIEAKLDEVLEKLSTLDQPRGNA